MRAAHRNLLAGAAACALLSSCGGDSNSGAPPVATPGPSPAPTTSLPAQIGSAFNALFTGSADVEATDPAAGSVPAPDLNNEAITG